MLKYSRQPPNMMPMRLEAKEMSAAALSRKELEKLMLARKQEGATNGIDGDHEQAEDVDQGEAVVNQVEERPVVGGHGGGGQGVVAFTDEIQRVWVSGLSFVVGAELARW